ILPQQRREETGRSVCMEEKKTVSDGMAEPEKRTMESEENGRQEEEYPEPDENWAHETVQELLDFWEEQGVYIRE
ncbi:MAG: hypothetical protein LUE63_07565, partial [Lachnospiraceae bacterium]|nr:hypothetical protein [Lachnospiraceae bacterium]